MKTTLTAFAAIILLMVCAVSAAEPQVARTLTIGNPVSTNYNWHPHNKVGIAQGTFLGVKNNNRALIKDADGTIMEIPLFHLAPLDLSYILTELAKFPEKVKDVVHQPGTEPVLDLRTADLPVGPLKEWKNNGAVGGSFRSMNNPPVVTEIDGRKGVRFDYSQWYIDPAYNAMVADVLAPKSLGEGKPFTLSAWVYHPEPPDTDDPEAIISWHSKGGDHGTTIDYKGGSHVAGMGVGAYVAGMGEVVSNEALNPGRKWMHLACVYTGGLEGEYRVYENGNLKYSAQYDNLPEIKTATDITTTSAVLRGVLHTRDNKPAFVAVYAGERDCHYWWQMRHVSYWGQCKQLGWTQPGDFSVKVTDLKPGTRYYFRMISLDNPQIDWWWYGYKGRRWANGAGEFITAIADGTPGSVLPVDNDQFMFLGVQWGSRWYMSYQGPSAWFRGYIGDLKLYDRALDQLDVRKEIGFVNAFGELPENKGACNDIKTALTWRKGAKNAANFRVFLAADSNAVAAGTCKVIETTNECIDKVDLLCGRDYFWRVEQLDATGASLSRGEVWKFTVTKGQATDPFPPNEGTVNLLGDFNWLPGAIDVKEQRLYVAESEEAVRAATKPVAKMKGDDKGCFKPDVLVAGKKYFWRIESVQADGAVTHGAIWSFSIRDYFTPEPDGWVSDPYWDEIVPGRPGTRVMEGRGHPTITTPGADEEDLRTVSYGTAKYIGKSSDFKRHLMAYPCATTCSTFEGSPMVRDHACGSYGGIPHWNMTMHEMGHQMLMNGLGAMSEDFYNRLNKVFIAHGDNNAWLGDYAASNIGENMACSGPQFTTAVERDKLRRSDSATYYLLEEYLSGDLYIDLTPAHGIVLDKNDAVTRWGNNAGLDEMVGEHYAKMAGSVGGFDAIGAPALDTVDGVTAVRFGGNDALQWDSTTMLGLESNQAWSVEFWVYRDKPATGDGVMLAWGPEARGVRVMWGDTPTAYRVCGATGAWTTKPAMGAWQHIAYVFEGGGLADGEGAFKVFVNSKKVYEGKHKFALDPQVPVSVGGVVADGKVTQGFSGAMAHVRVYNYAISTDQVVDHFNGEKVDYRREKPAHIGGKLYVDLDSRLLTEPGDEFHRPLYSKQMHKPWLRSWANLGTLQGRVHNDISAFWHYSGSTPLYKETNGTKAPIFMGKDRMVSVMPVQGTILDKAPGTLETWVFSQAEAKDEIVLEWGDFQLDARYLKPGWQHVGVIFSGNKADVFINGERAVTIDGALKPGANDHLHLGGHYDPIRWNWKRFFNGAIALVRVHADALTPEQLAANAKNDYLSIAHNPSPAPDEMVAAERKPALSWTGGLRSEAKSEVFFGESSETLKAAGTFASGEFKPAIEPSKSYYWRVGSGPVWSFSTREGAVVSLSAAGLQKGPLATWKNAGRAGGSFVPADRGDMFGPSVQEFRQKTGIGLSSGKILTSSFNAPDRLKNGPFTIVYEVANENPSGASPILTWGTDKGMAKVFFGTYNEGSKCLVWSGGDIGGNDKPREGSSYLAYTGGNTTMAYYWKQFVITYQNGTMKLYLNGACIRVATNTYSISELGKLVIGFRGDRGGEVLLRDLRVFSAALDDSDIKRVAEGKAVRERDLAVSVQARGLAVGKRVMSVENKGSLKGTFGIEGEEDRKPEVKELGGKACVAFNGTAMLQSDFLAPKTVINDHPFTVEMLVYVDEDNDARVLAFSQDVTRRSTAFGARGGLIRELRGINWNGGTPRGAWTWLAWVYDGGPEAMVRLYRDGKLNNERPLMSIDTLGGYPLTIGGMMHPALGERYLFKGGIAELRVYDYPRTAEEIAATAGK